MHWTQCFRIPVLWPSSTWNWLIPVNVSFGNKHCFFFLQCGFSSSLIEPVLHTELSNPTDPLWGEQQAYTTNSNIWRRMPPPPSSSPPDEWILILLSAFCIKWLLQHSNSCSDAVMCVVKERTSVHTSRPSSSTSENFWCLYRSIYTILCLLGWPSEVRGYQGLIIKALLLKHATVWFQHDLIYIARLLPSLRY